MNIIYRGTFNTKEKDKLHAFLKLTDKVDVDKNGILSEYYISRDSINFDRYRLSLEKLSLSAPIDCEINFTKEELQDVKYWTIRSTWRNGYPANEDSYLHDHFGKREETLCDCNLTLKNPVAIKKLPNFKNKNFFQLFWLESLLFCSEEVKRIIEKESITGIELLPTYRGKKSTELIEGTYQLKVINKTRFNRFLNKNEFRHMEKCKECGSVKVYASWDSIYRYDIEEFDVNADIFYSNDVFNSEAIIISTKFKDILVNERLTKGLVFQPVFLKNQEMILGEFKQLDYTFDERRLMENILNDSDIPIEYKEKFVETHIYDYSKYISNLHNQ